jgi:HSP20 family protein
MANRDLTPWRQSPAAFARDPFSTFRREMDRLFDDVFAPAEGRSFAPMTQGGAEGAAVRANLDVHENEQAYTVTAELAGVDQKDIELSLQDNALTLRGEKRSERNEEDGGRRYSERSFGRFERTIPFAHEIDADRVEASCENGVLKVVLPKNAQARDKTRRIQIRGQSGAGANASSAKDKHPPSVEPAPSLGGGAPGQSPPPVAGA